jgi:hypothetical protein
MSCGEVAAFLLYAIRNRKQKKLSPKWTDIYNDTLNRFKSR